MRALVFALMLAVAATLPSTVVAYTMHSCPKYTLKYSPSSSSAASQSLGLGLIGADLNSFMPNAKQFPEHPRNREFAERAAGGKEARAVSLESKCGYVSVPQDHNNPSAGTTHLYIKCYTSSTSTGLMFMLQGGPGAGSSSMEHLMNATFVALAGTYDVCTYDFRGVYRSSRLDCPATGFFTPGSPGGCSMDVSEEQPCRDELANYDIDTYTSTQAAHDLAFLIDNYPSAKLRTAIYATSYGTFHVYRFAQLYPDREYLYIADSVANPLGTTSQRLWMNNFDVHIDMAMRRYLKSCADDSYCSTRLTKDPEAFARDTLAKVFDASKSSCPLIADKYSRTDIVLLMYSALRGYFTRPLVPAILYRLSHCASNDVAFLDSLMDLLVNTSQPTTKPCADDFTQTVYYQITFTDLFEPNITRQTVLDRTQTLLFNCEAGIDLYDTRQRWSATASDYSFLGVNTFINGTFLVLAGEFDPQTPESFSATFFQLLQATKKYYALAKRAPHVVAASSGVPGETVSQCAVSVIADFVNKNGDQPNTSCLASLPDVDFQGDREYNEAVLGVTDIYDGSLPFTINSSAALISAIVLGIICLALLVTTIALIAYINKRRSSVSPS